MQDLSGLAAGWPSYGNSQAGGNQVTDKSGPQLALPGSDSEVTAGVPAFSTPDLSNPLSYHNALADAPADHPANMWQTVPSAADTDANWTPGYPDR